MAFQDTLGEFVQMAARDTHGKAKHETQYPKRLIDNCDPAKYCLQKIFFQHSSYGFCHAAV